MRKRCLELKIYNEVHSGHAVPPPGVPERTLLLLRQAFTQAMRDPALIETATS
jgi:hypothetical protein